MENEASAPAMQPTKPLVARATSSKGVWIFGGGLTLSGLLLFTALEARRAEPTSPATMAGLASPNDMIAAPPPLAIPEIADAEPDMPAFKAQFMPSSGDQPFLNTPPLRTANRSARQSSATTYVAPSYSEAPYSLPPVLPLPQANNEAPRNSQDPESLAGPRAGATRLENPSTTVPRGAVIQAVLETALDSNRPGFARAIVSRNVRGFDGSKILIPRGSRLVGEYKADVVQGQNRAFIQWQTLTRPDGVQIAVDSPAADPLGRAGVKGKVNSHFFERFAGAILQSTLDIGVGIATRKVADDTVIFGLPGSTQSVSGFTPPNVNPTLKVSHGSSVSVFVARDLDFIAAY